MTASHLITLASEPPGGWLRKREETLEGPEAVRGRCPGERGHQGSLHGALARPGHIHPKGDRFTRRHAGREVSLLQRSDRDLPS